jgi:putative flippase GtrA
LLDYVQLARFGAVGLVNTAAGYIVIVIGLVLGAGDVLANATGYVVGLTLSYFLNSRWTFRRASRVGPRILIRYLAVFVVAYGVNLTIVFAGRRLGYPENPLVHLAGVGGYAAFFYIGAAMFVFGNRAVARR